MNTDDFKLVMKVKELCELLNLELLLGVEHFKIVGNIAEIERSADLKEIYYFLRGYKQCLREHNDVFNYLLIKEEERE